MACSHPPPGRGSCWCDPLGDCPWRDTTGVAEYLDRVGHRSDPLPAKPTQITNLTPEQRLVRFKVEYAALCHRYGVVVDSCGCCNSPWLVADPTAKTGGSARSVTDHLNSLKPIKEA